jgi:hypothetical protein
VVNPSAGFWLIETMTPIPARCGYRCDLCPAYRENLHGPADQLRTSDGWFKYYGFRIPPGQIGCDGCRDERPEASRTDKACPVRPCAIARGFDTCACCHDYGCEHLQSRTVTRESVEARFGAPVSPEDYRWFVMPFEGRKRLDEMRARRASTRGEVGSVPTS